MKRRDLLTGLGLAVMDLEAQQHVAESLYIPKPQLVEDRKLLHDFMDEYAFVELVTASPGVRITHVPVFLDRDAGQYGKIYGHISRQNAQSKSLDGQQTGVIVFRGPHSYISPTWYAKTQVGPTWNFAVVQATGRLKPVAGKDELHELLGKLIAKFEKHSKASYDCAKLPMNYKYGLMAGIIGFEMEIELLEGKFKLGQERSETDRQGVLSNLQGAEQGRSMYQFTADFYKRSKP